jgi:hypothetical protein
MSGPSAASAPADGAPDVPLRVAAMLMRRSSIFVAGMNDGWPLAKSANDPASAGAVVDRDQLSNAEFPVADIRG